MFLRSSFEGGGVGQIILGQAFDILFTQGLPSVGSNTAGANTLDFLRNSQQVCV